MLQFGRNLFNTGNADTTELEQLANFLLMLPNDPFNIILKQIGPRQIGKLLVYGKSKDLKNKLFYGTAVNGFWRPALRALHQIDPSIPVNPPDGTKDEDTGRWCYTTLAQRSHKIYKQQLQEAQSLRYKPPERTTQLSDIAPIKPNAPVLIERLQHYHKLLDDFNRSLIRPHIDITSTALRIRNIGISSIPEDLIKDEMLRTYWQSLTSLNCSLNELLALPQSLGNLTALQALDCQYNQLDALPQSIGKLVTLQELRCTHNKLGALPETIGSLVALRRFYCEQNELRALPDSIGNLTALQELYCTVNQLRALPESLCKPAALRFYCDYNQLRTLPDTLCSRFGKEWAERTLGSQTPAPEQQAAVFLPQFANNNAQTHRANAQSSPSTELKQKRKKRNEPK